MTEDDARALVQGALQSVELDDGEPLDWNVARTQPLRELGVSSLALFEFVSALEELGGFAFDDADVDSANFDTPETVVALLGKYPR